ncbi:MAG: hypothetical protein K6F91_01495 [Ruminococcus sp.]|nr:hypothetical protein [Ruminococcus sp.]
MAKAFDKDDPKWGAEYKELSELLTPQEYAQALYPDADIAIQGFEQNRGLQRILRYDKQQVSYQYSDQYRLT